MIDLDRMNVICTKKKDKNVNQNVKDQNVKQILMTIHDDVEYCERIKKNVTKLAPRLKMYQVTL